MVTDDYRELFAEPVETVQDVHQQLKRMRRFLTWKGEHNTPVTIYSWVGAATRYLLLSAAWWGILRQPYRGWRVARRAVVKWSPPNVITRW